MTAHKLLFASVTINKLWEKLPQFMHTVGHLVLGGAIAWDCVSAGATRKIPPLQLFISRQQLVSQGRIQGGGERIGVLVNPPP